MEMIKGNVDGNYFLKENESHLYHVALSKRYPLGNMEYEETTSIQKFEPREFERFEKYGSKGYRNRVVLHNPFKVKKVTSEDLEEDRKVVYEDRTREELIGILKNANITWKGNVSNEKLIKLYEDFKSQK